MKKSIFTIMIAAMLTIVTCISAFAGMGGWQQNSTGWWWQNSDGSWPANKWMWLDGNADGTAECYYFGTDGYLLVNTTTPDGCQVGRDGAWVVNRTVQSKPSTKKTVSQIYLYGEQHSQSKILTKELELWNQYYQNDGMRHLFIETPYYTAELLNLWMKSDSDDILDGIYEDWKGTLSYNPIVKDFYKQIKLHCPKTIFHGTDVGHQYDSIGERYLKLLNENGQENSEQYLLTQETIEQGKYYYENNADIYRENKMTENFIREYDKLNGASIMGIYGGAHTGLENLDDSGSVPCMANQLNAYYNGMIYSESLVWIAKDIEPFRIDNMNINGKDYIASYFGKQDLTGFRDFKYREFWRLENAYDDFKGKTRTGNVLPNDNYPMLIKNGQIFVIEYKKADGTIIREYYLSNGQLWEGRLTTEEFTLN